MESVIEVCRLGVSTLALARETFAMMVAAFEEEVLELSEDYLRELLARDAFVALAALQAGVPIGGVTAHVLPMTRNKTSELFIYDLAVHPDHRRCGVGRQLIETLLAEAALRGVSVAFVPADNEDEHALAFYRALAGTAAPVTIFSFES